MLKHFFSVSGFTMLSRIFGYIRDIAIAAFLGASIYSDAFMAAFRLPNLFRAVFGEGAMTAAFVPIFASYKDDKEKQQKFATSIFMLLLISLLLLNVLAFIFMPLLVSMITPGYLNDSAAMHLIIELSYICFIYIIPAALMSFCGSILSVYGNFWVFASTPVILNIIMIVALYIFGNTQYQKVLALTCSTVVAGILEVLYCYYYVRRCGIKFAFCIKILKESKDAISKFLSKFISAFFGASVVQINVFVSTIFASYTVGGISYLYYADRIYQLPLALIGTAMASVLLPTLSTTIANNKDDAIAYTNKSFIIVLSAIMPIVAMLFCNAVEVVELLFERNNFARVDTLNTATALKIYSLALPGFVLSKIYSTICFANKDTKTPAIISVVSLVFNISISWSLLSDYQFAAVAFGAVIGTLVSNVLLYAAVVKKGYVRFSSQFYIDVLLILIISALTLTCLFWTKPYNSANTALVLLLQGLMLLVCCTPILLIMRKYFK